MAVLKAWLSTEGIRLLFRALKARFRDQRAELEIVRRHLSSGAVACDIGAYKGSFTFWLSHWCRNGRVIAFEPQPDIARRLSNICHDLKLRNVTVEAKAAHSRSGTKELFVPRLYLSGASLNGVPTGIDDFETLLVPVISLDEYFNEQDKIELLKIDAEGAELEILKGAEQILRRHAPLLVFECENRHLVQGSVQDVFSWLEGMGYEGRFVSHNRLLPIAEFNAALHQRGDGEQFWKNKNYCANFVFRHAGLRAGVGSLVEVENISPRRDFSINKAMPL